MEPEKFLEIFPKSKCIKIVKLEISRGNSKSYSEILVECGNCSEISERGLWKLFRKQ